MDIVGPLPTRVYNCDTRFAYQIFSDDAAKQAMSSEIVEVLVEKFIKPYHIAPKAWIRNQDPNFINNVLHHIAHKDKISMYKITA